MTLDRKTASTVQIGLGGLRAEIVPSLGGGVARFDLIRGTKRIQLFRPWPIGGANDPNLLGLYVLVPWSNRISGNGFLFQGTFHPLKTNFLHEPCPIHGDGWITPWHVDSHDDRNVTLKREAIPGPGPYHYEAVLRYSMEEDGLIIQLAATNRGPIALPFGLGLHPWFPRTAQTRLLARADSIWLEDTRHLPVKSVPVHSCPDWDFSALRPLPPQWINNGFCGWNGRALIVWDDRDLALEVQADTLLSTFILYSPSSEANFFCFEPVSHAVDAHNLPPGPAAHGLTVLEPDATVTAKCSFRPCETWTDS